ncbi:conserved hypothetical protein [Methylobacterium sp. 4-46]|uniref:DUF4089 domain-containing protein n=1 Tax=unclassified Methylobacterium TaxID=2615210 RepID=UPI000165C8A1|nr:MULTISPECIES: DUF4089 domain-containing protein [Methylobacterium]ACA16602.1 conserved hypothetical protein [Methylobacterium sp. 4-46]WFT82306.1 DUF4089 domain-containing protein [Methylobacterium nodulans]
MTETPPPPAALAAYLDAAAPLLGLDVRPEWREGVLGHLATLLAAAARAAGHPLPDELEAAPVFEAAP